MVKGCKKKGRNLPFGLPIEVLFPHQQVIDGQGAEGCPLQTGHHRYADVRHKILPPSGRLDDKKKNNFLFMKKELLQKIIHFAITILTAIATTLGITSCIGLMQ